MKPHLPLLLLSSLLAALSASAVSTSYLADGVDEADLAHSERFYDVGKGHYWSGTGEPVYKAAKELYDKTGSFAFLGDLAPRMSGTAFKESAFRNLLQDGQTCGYQVPANMIQYWLSYYGPFYTGTEPLAYGLSYSRDYLEKLGGTLSLDVGMLFYDSWKDVGNNLAQVGQWYFCGVPNASLKPDASAGGFFADYFSTGDIVYLLFSNTIQNASNVRPTGCKSFSHELLKGFGMEEEADGSYSLTRPGQLVYLSLKTREGNVGHALTCYGYEADENGMVTSVKVVNSDDRLFSLFSLYIKEDAHGNLGIYTDAECRNEWSYGNYSWTIAGLEYINTPEQLVDLYHLYTADDTPLIWTGLASGWSADYMPATTDELPSRETGWVVQIAGQSFNSYFDESRPICFDDSAVNTTVHLSPSLTRGTLAPAEMHLHNSVKDYLFIGESGDRLQPDQLVIDGTGSATFRDLLLATDEIFYETYTLNFGTGARLAANTVSVHLHGVLELSGGTANIQRSLTFGENARLRVTSASSISGAITMQAGSVFDCVLHTEQADQALLTITGSLTLDNSVKLEVEGIGLTEGERYRVCSVTEGSIAPELFFTEHGSLAFSDNTLWLTYREVPLYKWSGGDGQWSSSVFGATSHNTVHADIEFDDGSGTITLSGKVTPHHLSVCGGAYTFAGAGASIDCEGFVNLSGDADLTLDIPISAEGIILEDEATLTLKTGRNSTLSFISAAEHTHLNFRGAVTYDLEDAGVLAGAISVGAGTTLDFRLAHDEYLEGAVTAVSSSAAIRFENASTTRDIVVYEVGDNMEHFLGTVYVGRDGAARHTTLSLDFAPEVGTYAIAAGSELLIQNSCTLKTAVSGLGTLALGEGADVSLAVQRGRTSFADTLTLDVRGSAEVGTLEQRLSSTLARTLNVSGHVSLHLAGGSTQHYNKVYFDGGSYLYYTAQEPGNVTLTIDNLEVGKKGGHIARVQETLGAYYNDAGITRIGSITGSGKLTLSGQHFLQLSYFSIAGVGAAGYTGDIHVDNAGAYGDVGYHQTVLELGAGVYGGAVMLANAEDNVHSRSSLGIRGDVSVRGLESEAWGDAYVYSGYLKTTKLDTENPSPAKMVEAETHTLTLDTAEDHHFSGEVLGALNLVKTGKGTQSFRGDMSAFTGSVAVSGGTLSFSQNISVASARVENQSRLTGDADMRILGALTLDSGELIARALTTTTASFSGVSKVHADSITSSGAWTLNLSQEHLQNAALEMVSLNGSGSLNLGELHICYNTEDLSLATYKLLTLSRDMSEQLSGLSILCNGTELHIGAAGNSPLYLQSSAAGYELMLEIADGTAPLPRDEIATLHWQKPEGIWSLGTGENSGVWESEHENSNFHSSDAVVFSDAAAVTISGFVTPSGLTVDNASGTVAFVGATATSGISGLGGLEKSGNGTLTINTANTYKGGTTVQGGTLNVGHLSALGTGTVSLTGGTLNLGDYAVKNPITATGGTLSAAQYAGVLTILGDVSVDGSLKASTLHLNGGTLHGDISSGRVGILNANGGVIDGSLTLNGGTVHFMGEPLLVSGNLILDRNTRLGLSAYDAPGAYTLISAASVSGSADMLSYTTSSGRRHFDVSVSGQELLLTVTYQSVDLTWSASKGVWRADSVIGSAAYENGDTVRFDTAAAVTIAGEVAPGDIVVNAAGTVSFVSDKMTAGSGIAGDGSVTKSGAGVLTMNAGNRYSGGTVLNAGTIKATAADSFGTGTITVNGGTLDLASKPVTNDIVLSGTDVIIKGDAKYLGHVSVEGAASLLAKTSYKGTTTVGTGSSLTLAAAATMAGSVALDGGTLIINNAKGMTLAQGTTMTLSSGGFVDGLLKVGAGSVLVWGNGGFAAAPVLNGGTLDLGGEGMLTLTGAAAQVQFGTKLVDLPGKGIVKTSEILTVNGGTVTLSAASGYDAGIEVAGGTLKLSTGKVTTANDITVSGTAAVVNGATHTGNIIVTDKGALAKGTAIKLLNAEQRVELNGDGVMLGTISGAGRVVVNGDVDITGAKLTNADILLSGTLTHTKGLTLVKGQTLTLNGGSVNGTLNVAAGSVLAMNGHTLSAAPVLKGGTYDDGGSNTLTLTGAAADISLNEQALSLLSKSYLKSDAALTVRGGSVTVNDFGVSTQAVTVTGGTLKLSTGKVTSSNDIMVDGTATVVNGATHTGNIIVTDKGALAKGTAIKLLNAEQRVELNGDGVMLGTISGAGRVVVNGDVDITGAKLTNADILLSGTLTHSKGLTLVKGQTLTLNGGSVNGTLNVAAGSVLAMNGHTLSAAPVLKGGTYDDGGSNTLTLTGAAADISLNEQSLSLLSKSYLKSDAALTVRGGSVTVNDFGVSTQALTITGGTLKLSTGKVLSSNDIMVDGTATVVNGATHIGNIIVTDKGALAKGTAIKLLNAEQRVELNGDGVMLGTISGAGRVVVNGDVDITGAKLTNADILLSGTLTHSKGLTLVKGQTLTLNGGSVNGMLNVAAGSVLAMNGHTLSAAPVLKGGTYDDGGSNTLTLTGAAADISLNGQALSLLSKSYLKSDAALTVRGGSVTVNDFGVSTQALTITGGTLKLSTGKVTSSNDIMVDGTATVVNGATHTGNIIVTDKGALAKGTAIKLLNAEQRVELNGDGVMLGTISGAGRVVVNGDVDITGAKLTNADILLSGTLTHTKGLTLVKGQTLTLNGGSVNGTLNVAAGSVLAMNGHTLSAAPVLKGGTYDDGGSNTLTLTGAAADISLNEQSLSLLSKSYLKSDAALTVRGGSVTVNDFGVSTQAVTVTGGTLKLSTGKVLSSNDIMVDGTAIVVNGATHTGNIIVTDKGALAKGTAIKLLNAEQRVELNGGETLLGTISGTGVVDVNASINATAAKISAAHLNLNHGCYTNTKGLTVAKGQTLTLAGASLNLGTTGTLSTVAGSTLVVRSVTSLTGNLTLGGGTLTFDGGSLDVSGTLTLSKAMTVQGSGVITYTNLKSSGGDLSALFGGAEVVQEGNTLTITGVALRSGRMAPAPLDTAVESPLMAAVAPEPVLAPEFEFEPEPEPNPVADALVQADWGILDAERAFMGAVKDRRQHAALLDKGRGAAWVSAFGSIVRHGSKGLHHGSDGNVEGAAFGLEHAVSETGTLGLAVGRSKNRIAATGVTHLRQETAHVALYGQKQLTHGFTADATAAWGDTETKLNGNTLSQKSAALSARLMHAQMLTEATAFRTFGGLTYEATESGSTGTTRTGSVQNLRAELGAGATHTVGKAHLYAEAALTADLVRHNPTSDLEGIRTHGANPGRLGLRATLGGFYEFTDTWSGTASYSVETEARSTSHTLNIGVSKSF